MLNLFYSSFPSPFDTFTLVWKELTNSGIQLQRIFLSDSEVNSKLKALESFQEIEVGSSSQINIFGEKIQHFFKGEEVEFNLERLDFKKCSKTQKKVLLAEYAIPRGWISTYKRIAENIGLSNGARVVGNALAKNPFPIFIPCHRAIKSNGELGGFQGGIKMKRTLLEMEGIEFSDKGKVITDKVFY
ncbi:MAG: methylated-DNA--[protein]-cysteine S-methyltransferase [Promethearchaeota archaeon]